MRKNAGSKSSFKKIVGATLVVLSLFALGLTLSGCGNNQDDAEVLNIYNWGLYMDPEVLTDFTAETGIQVKYEEFPTNEDMYTKLKNGVGKYDLIIPSDYMVQRMIKEDMLNPLNFANIPNYANIDSSQKDLAYDPQNQYSVPYTWGTVGIVYNSQIVDVQPEAVDWEILFNEKYSKQILMSNSVRDTLGVALQYLGYSQNSRNAAELNEAKELLLKQKPLVLAYVVDEVRDLMLSEEAAIAMVWSGEGMMLEQESPNLKYVIPKSGTNMWVDAMVVPKSAQNQDYAEKFIDFICRPDISARICDYIGYATPSAAAKKLINQDVVNNFNAYPDGDFIKNKTEMFEDPSDFLEEYDRIWTEITSF